MVSHRLPVPLLLLLVLLTACGGATTASPAGSPTPAGPPTPAVSSTAAATIGVPARSGAVNALTVFAAASLTDAFKELGKNFEAANPGAAVTFNFAGSQQLAQQIAQGAPADVFAAANKATMDTVVKSGLVVSGTQRIFARNRLVVIYPKDNPAHLTSLQDLAKPGLKLDLAAKAVPAGQYALDVLSKASADPAFGSNFKERVVKNVVSYEDNVRSVLTKVALGEVDAGIVYTTDSAGVASKVGSLPIPDKLNTIAAYPLASLAAAKQADMAQKFVRYVLSVDGQAVLAKYGFLPPATQPATF